jgi:hypothetical protein
MRHLLADFWMRLRGGLAGLWIFLPIGLIAVLIASYTWWWQQVADGVRSIAGQFQLDQHAQGREALWDDLDVSGFPYRVEAQFNAPRVTAPDRGFAWDGKTVVLDVQPLRPRHVALNFLGHQHFLYAKDGRFIEGGGDADKALVNIVTGSNGTEELGIDIQALSGQGDVDARHIELVVQNATATARVTDDNAAATLPQIDLAATLSNIALRGDVVLPLGPTINLLDLQARLKLPSTLAEASGTTLIAAWRATGTPVEIENFNLDWGGVTLAAHGELKLDSHARPEGRLQLKIGNHRRLLEVLIAEGWVNANAQKGIDAALNTLAFISGDPERRVDVAVRFTEGDVFLEFFGLVPIRVGQVGPIFAPPQLSGEPGPTP